MSIPKDKLLHAGVGVVIALLCMALWAVASHLGLVPLAGMPGAIALGGIVAGITKEGADYMDNKANPGMHGVEALDALATAAPGFAIALIVQQVLLSGALAT